MFVALRLLVVKCKYNSLETKAEKYDAVAAVAAVLQRKYDHPDVAVQGCIALKYLTRNGRRPGESSVEICDFVLLLLFQFPPSQDGCLRRCCLPSCRWWITTIRQVRGCPLRHVLLSQTLEEQVGPILVILPWFCFFLTTLKGTIPILSH